MRTPPESVTSVAAGELKVGPYDLDDLGGYIVNYRQLLVQSGATVQLLIAGDIRARSWDPHSGQTLRAFGRYKFRCRCHQSAGLLLARCRDRDIAPRIYRHGRGARIRFHQNVLPSISVRCRICCVLNWRTALRDSTTPMSSMDFLPARRPPSPREWPVAQDRRLPVHRLVAPDYPS